MKRPRIKGLHKHKEPKKNRFGCGICYPPTRHASRARRERLAAKFEQAAEA